MVTDRESLRPLLGVPAATGAPLPVAAADAVALDPVTRRSVRIAAFGTIVEWYDFSLYLYLTPVLSRVFFHTSGGTTLTYGVFAIAYLVRPLGAMFFGNLGDRMGRRITLVVSAGVMAFAMAVTALLPSYDRIGSYAGVLLLLLRGLMGFSVGGEYTGVLVYLLEVSDPRRRGYVASWAPATSQVGALLAVGLATVLTACLPTAALDAWGWRVLYGLGAVLALGMLLARRSLQETRSFRRLRAAGKVSRAPVRDVLRRQPRGVLAAFVMSALGSISYYLAIAYVPTYLSDVVGRSPAGSLALSTVAAVVVLAVTPLIGALADRAGRKPVMFVSALAIAIPAGPAFAVLGSGTLAATLVAMVVLAVPAAAASAVFASAIPEQLATAGRFSGLALGYNMATALFGGLSPLIASVLIWSTGWRLSPGLLLAGVALLVVPFLVRLPETARLPLPDEPPGPDGSAVP
jgi:MHS family proline/betaine transporter-like MFS transporter